MTLGAGRNFVKNTCHDFPKGYQFSFTLDVIPNLPKCSYCQVEKNVIAEHLGWMGKLGA
uniref:Uncharacterized protein n=2 Tax=Oryza TaxID=4527 RepID=A0A0D3FFI1_9ORYZ